MHVSTVVCSHPDASGCEGERSLFVAGCGAPTIARRVRDGLLRDPAAKSPTQFTVQSAAMGTVQSVLDARGRLWTGPGGLWPASLWPAIWSIRCSAAAHRCVWMGRPTTSRAGATATAM